MAGNRTPFNCKPCNFQASCVSSFDMHIRLNSSLKTLAQNNFRPVCLSCKFQDNVDNFKRNLDCKRHKKSLEQCTTSK